MMSRDRSPLPEVGNRLNVRSPASTKCQAYAEPFGKSTMKVENDNLITVPTSTLLPVFLKKSPLVLREK